MMPYSDRLRDVADWFRQLWAESLGKRHTREGAEVFVGPTPVSALGATDQHSQVQLYMEGPFDKTITFLIEADRGEDLQIPGVYPDVAELGYLGDHTLGELLRVEMLATEAALAARGRMSMTIEIPRVDARSIGELFMFLQIATVYAGGLYGVDPLDQPGVELGKQLTYGIMGRGAGAGPTMLITAKPPEPLPPRIRVRLAPSSLPVPDVPPPPRCRRTSRLSAARTRSSPGTKPRRPAPMTPSSSPITATSAKGPPGTYSGALVTLFSHPPSMSASWLGSHEPCFWRSRRDSASMYRRAAGRAPRSMRRTRSLPP
jgi:hypothetical protein